MVPRRDGGVSGIADHLDEFGAGDHLLQEAEVIDIVGCPLTDGPRGFFPRGPSEQNQDRRRDDAKELVGAIDLRHLAELVSERVLRSVQHALVVRFECLLQARIEGIDEMALPAAAHLRMPVEEVLDPAGTGFGDAADEERSVFAKDPRCWHKRRNNRSGGRRCRPCWWLVPARAS